MLSKIIVLFTQNSFKKYFFNTSWLFIERILKLIFNLVIISMLTRLLGPKNFGLLSYSQSFVGIFIAFSTLGLESILVKELIRRKNETDQILGTVFIIKLSASFLALLILFIITIYTNDSEARLLINIIGFTLIFQSLNLGMDTYFQANVKSRLSVISNLGVFVLSSILKLILIGFKFDLIYFAYAIVLDSVLVFIGYLIIYNHLNISIYSLKFDKKLAIYFLKSGWPMMLVALGVFLYTRVDQIMIRYFLDDKNVGYYSAALRVSEFFNFIPLLIVQSIFPKIIKEHNKENQRAYRGLLLNVYKIVVWISIPIILITVTFRELIINILYGPDFSYSSDILLILILNLLLFAIGSVNTKILYVENYEIKYMKRSILGVVTNIFLNFILIPLFGELGAAYSTLITLISIHYIYDLFDEDLHKFFMLKIKCFIPNSKILK